MFRYGFDGPIAAVFTNTVLAHALRDAERGKRLRHEDIVLVLGACSGRIDDEDWLAYVRLRDGRHVRLSGVVTSRQSGSHERFFKLTTNISTIDWDSWAWPPAERARLMRHNELGAFASFVTAPDVALPDYVLAASAAAATGNLRLAWRIYHRGLRDARRCAA